ncbi:Chromosome partition protein Smc [Carpediemonas membranifera]|uniref:Chromosome partition protein Smc n=1 Tax=Carpediemonas membranifera TaxID=201153 RepID=A0A8J6ATY0_9EUKA|nr:Chromosome partition protein Smc [Carpediemonas membranifera]|eukprot:KAG9394531.1 Chromosome partition protein Smc [Carpediemonas membranifera]
MTVERVRELQSELHKVSRDYHFTQKSLERSQELRQGLEAEVNEQKTYIRKMEQKLSREAQLSGLNKATNKLLKLQEQQQQDRHVIRAQDEEITRLQRELQIVNDALCTREEDLGLDPVETVEDSLLYMLSQNKVDYDNAMVQLKHAEDDLRVQKERVERLEADLNAAETENQELQAEVEESRGALDAEKRRSAQYASKLSAMEHDLDALEQENASLSDATRDLQTTLERNERDVADVQYDANSQKVLYDELLQRFDSKAQELRDLHEKYETLQAEHIADLETAASEREALESIIDQLQREVDHTREDSETYRSRVEDARLNATRTMTESDDLRRELAEQKANETRLERELDDMMHKAAELQDSLEKERAGNEEQARRHRRLAETAEEATKKLALLETQVNELRDEKDALRTAKSQLQQTLLREIRALRTPARTPPSAVTRPSSKGSPDRASAVSSSVGPARAMPDSATRAMNLETLRAMASRSRSAALQSPEPDQIVEFDGGETLEDLAH